MVNREELLSLAERVEALSGPSPEVDEAIHAALSGAEIEWQDYQRRNAYHRDGHWVSIGPIPSYTASIDSAMLLADPSWWIRVGGPLTDAAYGYSREDQRQITAGFEMIGAPYSVGARSAGTDPIGQIARALTAASLHALAQPTVPQA